VSFLERLQEQDRAFEVDQQRKRLQRYEMN